MAPRHNTRQPCKCPSYPIGATIVAKWERIMTKNKEDYEPAPRPNEEIAKKKKKEVELPPKEQQEERPDEHETKNTTARPLLSRILLIKQQNGNTITITETNQSINENATAGTPTTITPTQTPKENGKGEPK